jgi:hypothetical protein
METRYLSKNFIVYILVGVAFSCQQRSDPDPAVCRLISTTDQLVEVNGRLVDEMQRSFTYNNAVLTSIAERSMEQEAGFLVEYENGRVVRAVSNQASVTLGYKSAATQPSSATFSRGGQLMSQFDMEYTSAGRMSRIVESRTVLPANSLTTVRAFTFTYDNLGSLATEHARFTLRGGVVVEQETDYKLELTPSPYARFPEPALLTVVALSQAVETRPARFWQTNTPVAYKSYELTSSGSRGILRDSSTFVTSRDTDGKLISQDQTALLYQLGSRDPITKRNRQAFSYQCD